MAINHLRVGLTGGIGSGKSTVARYLCQIGIPIIDADAISRSLTSPGGAGIEPIRCFFGDSFIDMEGGLRRAKMRQTIFSEPSAKLALEGILHPLIKQEMEAQAHLETQSDIIVFDIPLMVESGKWRSYLHRVIVIDCDEKTQIQRVSQRPGWSNEMAKQVIRQQASRSSRQACADLIMSNQNIDFATLEHTVYEAVQQLHCWACEKTTVTAS
ncbi:MAG: dephospho-CoA kinase [Burkholderiales bacterium]|jgi:dephospho-CoA kinase